MELRVVVVVLALFATRLQASGVDDTHYVAAVVEYATPYRTGLEPEQHVLANVKVYADFMAKAAEQDVDIIVFPELGLEGDVALPVPMPTPAENVIPCSAAAAPQALKELSCLAAKHKMYLVVNLANKQPCANAKDAPCPAKGFFSYNTNVVFDRRGQVVARYHKYHLIDEPDHDVPPAPEISFFDTDFGVRFGTFVCFDILFDKPSVDLIRLHGITDVVYPIAWGSGVPFHTATQVHSGWAHALDVTMLAAGLNDIDYGSTGSGLYRGRNGIMDSVFYGDRQSKLIVGRVPKRGHWDDAVYRGMQHLDPVLNYGTGSDPFDEMKTLFLRQDNMTLWQSKLLPRPGRDETLRVDEDLCHDGLCCRFRVEGRGVSLFQTTSAAVSMHGGYSWRRRSAPVADEPVQPEDFDGFDGFHYRIVVFNGINQFPTSETMGVQICGLVSCLGEDLQSCGWQARGLGSPNIKWTEFLSVNIEGDFEVGRTLQLASTLAGPRFEPLPASIYKFESSSLLTSATLQTVSLSMQQPLIDLRTFGIYGRSYARDGPRPPTDY